VRIVGGFSSPVRVERAVDENVVLMGEGWASCRIGEGPFVAVGTGGQPLVHGRGLHEETADGIAIQEKNDNQGHFLLESLRHPLSSPVL
jgi:hypothetical protein